MAIYTPAAMCTRAGAKCFPSATRYGILVVSAAGGRFFDQVFGDYLARRCFAFYQRCLLLLRAGNTAPTSITVCFFLRVFFSVIY